MKNKTIFKICGCELHILRSNRFNFLRGCAIKIEKFQLFRCSIDGLLWTDDEKTKPYNWIMTMIYIDRQRNSSRKCSWGVRRGVRWVGIEICVSIQLPVSIALLESFAFASKVTYSLSHLSHHSLFRSLVYVMMLHALQRFVASWIYSTQTHQLEQQSVAKICQSRTCDYLNWSVFCLNSFKWNVWLKNWWKISAIKHSWEPAVDWLPTVVVTYNNSIEKSLDLLTWSLGWKKRTESDSNDAMCV